MKAELYSAALSLPKEEEAILEQTEHLSVIRALMERNACKTFSQQPQKDELYLDLPGI